MSSVHPTAQFFFKARQADWRDDPCCEDRGRPAEHDPDGGGAAEAEGTVQ